jgi:hypothetical protein
MANPRKTQELTLKLLRGQDPKRGYAYTESHELRKEKLFYKRVCKKTQDSEGKEVMMVGKNGEPVFYQLQALLDLEILTGNITEEKRDILLQDPQYKDPVTGNLKVFPYKTLMHITRVLTEADGKEWLTTFWSWEGLQRDKQIWTYSCLEGTYLYPEPVTRLWQPDPAKKPEVVITSMNYREVYEIPFSRENYDKEISKRNAPRDEKNISMTLQKIKSDGTRDGYTYQVTDKEQFLTRPFEELYDYLASAPLKDTAKTKMGAEKQKENLKQYG